MDISKLKGTAVDHRVLHTGIVIDTEEQGNQRYFTVRFDMGNKEARFPYPDAFKKDLTAYSYQSEIKKDLHRKSEIEELEQKKAGDKLNENSEKETESDAEPKKYNGREKTLKKKSVHKKEIHRRNTIGEGVGFSRIVDVMNQCFGESFSGYQQSYVDVGNGYYVWCPKLAIYKTGVFRAADKKYKCINIIEKNGDIILEGNEDPTVAIKEYGPYSEKRAVFMQKRDGFYHFIGVYEYGGFDKERKCRIHKRISKTLDLSHWNISTIM